MPLSPPFKINVPKTETTVNLESASFIVIMLLHEGLTHIQALVAFWREFRFKVWSSLATKNMWLR